MCFLFPLMDGHVRWRGPTLKRSKKQAPSRQRKRTEYVPQPDRSPVAPSNSYIISDVEYLRDPGTALGRMRDGVTVIVEPTNGGARMVLVGELVSDVVL